MQSDADAMALATRRATDKHVAAAAAAATEVARLRQQLIAQNLRLSIVTQEDAKDKSELQKLKGMYNGRDGFVGELRQR
jgi:hypothetical protein